ncbi:MAG: MoaD/ThiS family protein [Phycisphaerales bacterium]|nr:MoaD/ThiS family protein [Phycisphaerales bacterium]
MAVRVRLFAAIREAFGVDALDLDASTVEEVAEQLRRRCPSAEPLLARSRFAVNRAFSPAQTPLLDQDEVAVIPPVSGG